ncbi:MAG: fibrobacter succinogenes major paralogous domain-containing protein [Chitinispirillales bacterium]|jgi:uncharacterized protein (TIGR02145 family)|nr:fibrobacter succinogenes major paralogous domain-containing protein [Chitinispirillales bacterium]
MRKLILTTAAVAAAIGLVGCDDPNTLIDKRDGQKYRTVMIGGDRWMAENLNHTTDSSWCYNNDTSYCKKYGRLYDWKTATTVCPKGWKLPSREDWNYLGQAVGGEGMLRDKGMIYWDGAGKNLKSKSGWNDRNDESSGNGTDSFGFSALPGGFRNSDGDFGRAGNDGYWWTASDYTYHRGMIYLDDYVYEYNDDKGYGLSVRCVADNP